MRRVTRSNGRIGPDVMAPGGFVWSVMDNSQGYTGMGGTSMACPNVTGISALLLQKSQTGGLVDAVGLERFRAWAADEAFAAPADACEEHGRHGQPEKCKRTSTPQPRKRSLEGWMAPRSIRSHRPNTKAQAGLASSSSSPMASASGSSRTWVHSTGRIRMR